MSKSDRTLHSPTDATRTQVKAMAGDGVAQHAIAKAFGISPPTLRKHYAAELGGAYSVGKPGLYRQADERIDPAVNTTTPGRERRAA